MTHFPVPRNSSHAFGVFLIGFMGCGKTTVGELLSQCLGWQFEDLDRRIQARAGATIPEIFSNHGEARFREIEREALLKLIDEMALNPTVVALGGGTFVQPENRSLLKQLAFPTVFLDADVEDLWQRCRSLEGERPLARDENQFRQLHEARRSFYMEAAMRVDTRGKDAEAVAAEIACRLHDAIAKEK
jgi:shikimate kinase